MSLEEVAILIEREHRLHQEWLSALANLEAYFRVKGNPTFSEMTMGLQEIMEELSLTQNELMDAVSRFSVNHALKGGVNNSSLAEHVATLQENIEILQQKITQKHQDLKMFHPLQQQDLASQPIQLALDNSMDLLKHLINSPK